MSGDISPSRWFEPTATMVAAAWLALVVRAFRGTSRVINGGMVFLAVCVALVLIVLWNRAQRPQPRHHVVYALLPITLIAALLAIDYRHMVENGIAINAAAAVALIAGGLWGRSHV